ncbi:putative bifunctional diguanylate cyclase/phosphodiesterase [Thiomicrorhabdus sediminis]|uniref:cyclic-guanylate-specific phosphodiesterase n=1 Tax=Thiomicrorhabdus sediminis TaxID=2580412 RepID=A0A4P9K4G1_9GAMM|nr:GGDEF and EAL domain-containing protein [Thiomicrorhabdus sediminis]QCU89798.1 EAL domain-containing protein [Thiomicrorhabdus sediminis]
MNTLNAEQQAQLSRRMNRERLARKSAERLLERKSLELFNINQSLQQTNNEIKKLSVAIEQSPNAVIITDTDAIIEYTNPSFSQLTGWQADEIRGKKTSILSSHLTPDSTYKNLWETITSGQVWHGEIYNNKKNGEQYLEHVTISPIFDENHEIRHYLSISEDITLKKEYEKQIHQLAHHDSLTGLLNRYSLYDRLKHEIDNAEHQNAQLAVMFLDLDRFKPINDTYGHKGGDQLLVEIGQLLTEVTAEHCTILARLGGDEFVAVIPFLEDPIIAAKLAQDILTALEEPIQIDKKHKAQTSASIGIAIYPNDGLSAAELLKNADTAMYHVKDLGRGDYEFFTEDMNKAVEERLILARELKLAVAENKLELYYQPKITQESNRLCGVEALLRWNHPELGFISPEKFIPIAEDNDLIIELGLWVIKSAFAQLISWQEKGLPSIKIAINISTKQLQTQGFVGSVERALHEFQVPPQLIEFEITESAAMDDPLKSIENLKALRNIGIDIAIDDFGTGYSSLAYLKSLPIQVLKIDKSFVMAMDKDENSAAIAKAIISLGHDLGYKIVAEGVETQQHIDALSSYHCDLLQGYFFSRPLPSIEMEKYMLSADICRH